MDFKYKIIWKDGSFTKGCANSECDMLDKLEVITLINGAVPWKRVHVLYCGQDEFTKEYWESEPTITPLDFV